MNNNKIILNKEYNEFYNKFYGIKANHTNAVNCICIIKKNIENKKLQILEYGCASGFNLRYLKNEGFNNLFGIDGYKNFIYHALNKNDKIKYKNLNFADLSISTDDFFEKKFDVIFTRGVLQQGKTRREKIKNINIDIVNIFKMFYKLLNNNGKIIISEGPVRDWGKLAKKANLKVVKKLESHNIYIIKKNLGLLYIIKRILNYENKN